MKKRDPRIEVTFLFADRTEAGWITLDPLLRPGDRPGAITAILNEKPQTVMFGWYDDAPLVHEVLAPTMRVGALRAVGVGHLHRLADLRDGSIEMPTPLGQVRLTVHD